MKFPGLIKNSNRKLLISILLGVGGFCFSLYSLRFENPPFSITITWSYFLPLMAGMAFGPTYGLIAGTLGLGAFFPFILYPNNGWANLVNSLPLVLWYVWFGYFAKKRQEKAAFWNHPFFIHLPFAVIYILFMRIFFPIAFANNPPFWNSQVELSMPLPVLEGVITKGIIMMYLMVILNTALLQINPIRSIFQLEIERASRNNGKIVSLSILGSILLWYVLILFNRIFIDKVFPQNLFQIRDPHETVAFIVFLAAGFFIGVIICQYVKSRLKAEDELITSKDNYRLIFEQAADAIFIADGQGNYLDVNKSGCNLTGYTRDEFLRLNIHDLVMPEEKPSVPNRINEINAGDIAIFERRLQHKSGAPIYVEIRARKLANGTLQGLVRDISQRKQIEGELRTSNNRFQQFMKYSPIYVYIKEVSAAQSIVLQASENYVEMIGIPGSLMVGKRMEELFPADLAAKITADDWAVVSTGNELKVEETLNGRIYTTIKFPIYAEDKTFLAGYSIDITDRKEAEEKIRQLNSDLERRITERTAQLAAANKELEAFAYSVSHDLRSPLRSMDGFSAALLEDYAEKLDDQGKDYLTRIQEASRRMGQLINDLLDLSRVTRAEINPQLVDLSKMARSITSTWISETSDQKICVDIADNIFIQGDPNLLRIALENLLSNAFKFSSKCKAPYISIGITSQAGEPVYFIRDNGIGFDMEYAAKLFIPFQRLHNVKDYPGTGIGLSIVQRIITKHGGHIWVESEVEKGTTFYFSMKSLK